VEYFQGESYPGDVDKKFHGGVHLFPHKMVRWYPTPLWRTEYGVSKG
jgi:hypothetical protein